MFKMDFVTSFFFGFILGLTGAMTPGQDTMLVLHCVAKAGKSAGIRASLGIGVALLFHATLTVLLIFVLDQSFGQMAKLTLQVGGVIFLSWFAYKLLFDHSQKKQEDDQDLQRNTYFVYGLLNNLLNYKAVIFFTSIVNPFIKPDDFSLGLTFLGGVVLAIPIWFVTLSVGFSKVVSRMTPKYYRILEIVSGLLFLGIALYGLITLIIDI